MKMEEYKAPWWSDLTRSLKNDPSFIAEGIAIDLAIKINERLKMLAISRKELATRLQVSQARVSQILGGQSNMTLISICKAAVAVGLKISLTFDANVPQRRVAEETFNLENWAKSFATPLESGSPNSIFDYCPQKPKPLGLSSYLKTPSFTQPYNASTQQEGVA